MHEVLSPLDIKGLKLSRRNVFSSYIRFYLLSFHSIEAGIFCEFALFESKVDKKTALSLFRPPPITWNDRVAVVTVVVTLWTMIFHPNHI